MSTLKPAIADDFEATIRIFRADEGGRVTPPFNGIRWDLNYANELPSVDIFMVWPIFCDEAGEPFPSDTPLPIDTHLNARMYVVVDEMRSSVHRTRIQFGTRVFCCEGQRRVAEGQVTKITGLYRDRN